MREIPVSNIEKQFVLEAATKLKRLDGRKLDEFRNFKIHFGLDWGSCLVTLGETKALGRVTCEIQEPKATRPNEGLLYVNVELTSMASPSIETGVRSDLSTHLNRMLEKCLKESKAVDLESLCIVADEKVWALRVDVIIVNHEGNLLDCATVAALSALAHFKRPDVTTDGLEVTIHDSSERDPIPITLHHFPVCVTFAFLPQSDSLLSDPTILEERVADACLVFGVNAYRELCALHLGGTAVLPPKKILQCANRAAQRAKDVVDLLKSVIIKDSEDREAGQPLGFAECIEVNKITSLCQERLKIQLNKYDPNNPYMVRLEGQDVDMKDESNDRNFEDEGKVEENEIVDLGDHSAELRSASESRNVDVKQSLEMNEIEYGGGGPSKWVIEMDSTPMDDATLSDGSNGDIAEIPRPPKVVDSIDLSGDDDEEVHIMDASSLEAADKVKIKPQPTLPHAETKIAKSQKRRNRKKNKNKS